MLKFSVEDIKTQFDLLNQEATEIRVFDPPFGNGVSFTVYGWAQFIERVKWLNLEKKVNVYIGVNQRAVKDGRVVRGDDSIVRWNGIYEDIDAHGGDRNDAKLTAKNLLQKLQSEGLNFGVAFTGGGYHLVAFFKEPVKISDNPTQGELTLIELKENLSKIKGYFDKLKKDKSIVVGTAVLDTTVFNPERIQRVIGTVNWKANSSSLWCVQPEPMSLKQVLDWCGKLEAKTYSVSFPERMQASKVHCLVMDKFKTEPFRAGTERNRLIVPNFLALNPTYDEIVQCANVQGKRVEEFVAWKKWKLSRGEGEMKFSCGVVRGYAEGNGMENVCLDCEKAKEEKLRRMGIRPNIEAEISSSDFMSLLPSCISSLFREDWDDPEYWKKIAHIVCYFRDLRRFSLMETMLVVHKQLEGYKFMDGAEKQVLKLYDSGNRINTFFPKCSTLKERGYCKDSGFCATGKARYREN